MGDCAVYVKPSDVLYVLYKRRARVHTHETIRKIVIVDGRLWLSKPRRLSPKEIRDLKKRGSNSMLRGFRAKYILGE